MACEVISRDVIQHIGVAVVKSVNDVPIEEDFKYLLDNDRSHIRAFVLLLTLRIL